MTRPIANGAQSVDQAEAASQLTITGDRGAALALIEALSLRPAG